MSEIVSRIGGSKSTIYSYFPSKDILMQAVLAHTAEIRLQQAFVALDVDRPLREILRQFGRAYLVQLLTPEMLSALRMAQQNAHRDGHGKQFYEAGPRAGWTLMQKYIEHHIQSGAIVSCDGMAAQCRSAFSIVAGPLLANGRPSTCSDSGKQLQAIRA